MAMEGSGPEIENLVFPNNLKHEDKKETEAVDVNGEAEKSSGVITNFISAFVSSKGKDEEVEEDKQVDKSDEFDEENKEEKEGGLLNHLISMVTPNQHGENAGSCKNENQETIVEDEDGGGGGVIHNFISNILHHNSGENNKIGEDDRVIEDGGGGGGGGAIVENGDSHLPTTNDADDRGREPGIEEASILIHSIVHD